LDFRFIHVYFDASLDARAVAGKIARIFPACEVDIRRPFRHDDDRIEQARITDVKQPFERQPRQPGTMPLYDGFVLQRIFAELIPTGETDHVHIIFTSLLACTFSEDDWRYHARTVICGTPSIISTAGIVEAPARPREFYLAQLGDIGGLKEKFAGRFIDYGDDRMAAAVTLYALQALFFFITDGEPFCDDRGCVLYNAHWQKELIYLIEKGTLCSRHQQMANKFNKRSVGR
jgi:hypothetical protein